MSENIKRPRGTNDLFYDDFKIMEKINNKLKDTASRYGFSFCDVPTFEESKLFHRSVGESSDIVRKETFDLINKGDKNYTLRPEFTACINRAVIENKFFALPSMPLKYSYFGKVFRYERPQEGRYREFHQFGVEIIDEKIDLYSTIDCLLLSIDSLKDILGDVNISVKLNFLGSFKSRENYKKALYQYFETKIDSMCEDCKRRLETNPLRILDCKIKEDQEIVKDAPKINDYLTKEDSDEFSNILSCLDKLHINYSVDESLVRGLDYYTGLVYELYSEADIGAICGGGKYSSLMHDIGGPEFEGIGFSIGVERLVLSLDDNRRKELLEEDGLDYFIIDLLKDDTGLVIANKLRQKGCSVSFPSFSRSLNGALKMADRLKASKVIIIDDSTSLKVKDMSTREQKEVRITDFISSI